MKDKADQIDEVEALFVLADADNDGEISLTEFRTVMLGMESGVRASSLDASFGKIDTDRNGHISFAELRAWRLNG